jgi:hypothetical protein
MGKKRRPIQRLNTRGPLVGRCNICDKVRPLTDDHTPPKGCGKTTLIEVHSLHDKLSASEERSELPRRFQAGISFRSLCQDCNNLLGGKYDPALAEMCSQVRNIVNGILRLPDEIRLQVRPQPILRSVLGHLAAQGIERPISEWLRNYLLDRTLPLPDEIRMYYWLYPHRSQILVRDGGRLEIASRTTTVFWLMKFFPLAFMATIGEPQQRVYRLNNLDTFRDVSFSDEYPVALRLRPIVPQHWPEHPGESGAVLYGPQAVWGDPLTRIRRV